jgi:capsular polysaccharide biosynthesis protein/Mrp family chromosome partitioning ATPase
MLKQQAIIAITLTVLGALAGLFVAQSSAQNYTASTTLFLRAPDFRDSSSAYQGDLFSQQRARTYSGMIKSEELAQMVIDRLQLDSTPSELAEKVTATAEDRTVLMDISATDGDARTAADIANAYGTAFPAYIARVENLGNDPAVSTSSLATVVNSATVPGQPDGIQKWMAVLLGAIVGLLLGVAGAWIRRRLDRSVRAPKDLERLEVPTLGVIPDDGRSKTGQESGALLHEVNMESFRRLAVNVEHVDVDRRPRVIGVLSPDALDGKSTVSANLAFALSERGFSVTAVDANPSNPTLTKAFGLGPEHTSQLAGGDVEPDPTNVKTVERGDGKVSVFGCGESSDGVLASDVISKLLTELKGSSDYVIVDGPALVSSANGRTIAGCVDAVVHVVRAGTRFGRVAASLRAVALVDGTTVGVVLNRAGHKLGE